MPKPCKELSRNETFEVYSHNKRQKLVKLISKKADGDDVILRVHPICNYFNAKLVYSVRMKANSQVEVFGMSVFLPEQCEKVVLKVLQPGMRSLPVNAIAQLVFDATQDARISSDKVVAKACKRLSETGALVKKKIVKGRGKLEYRAKLPKTGGTPVVECLGSTMKLGWVSKFIELKATGKYQVVVHWLDGSESFSKEEWLEPVTKEWSAHCLKQIQSAMRQPTKTLNPVPDWLMQQLSTPNRIGVLDSNALTDIAKHIGFVQEYREHITSKTRDRVIAYLDENNPGWRQIWLKRRAS